MAFIFIYCTKYLLLFLPFSYFTVKYTNDKQFHKDFMEIYIKTLCISKETSDITNWPTRKQKQQKIYTNVNMSAFCELTMTIV